MAVALTFSEVIREARAVQSYKGEDGFQLHDYINEVENLVRLAVEGPQREHVAQILMSKIQGRAAAVVRRLNDRNWENMKVLLTNTFGVKETYLQMKEDADRIRSKSAKEIFEHLQFNLDKLNLKYKLDNNHPFEFTPTNNESSILETFLNKIHRNDAMYLRAIPVTSLEQSYNYKYRDAIGKMIKIERIEEIVKTEEGIIVTGGEVDEIGIILIDIEMIIIGILKEVDEVNLITIQNIQVLPNKVLGAPMSLLSQKQDLILIPQCKEENLQTVDSQDENFNNHISIREHIVNKYQKQLFLVENEESRHLMTSPSRRRTVINSKQLDTPDKAINFLKIRLQPGTVAIYSEIDDHQYNKLQQIILEGFDNTVTKFIKVTQIKKEITNEENLIDLIKYYHEKETGHAGIRENYSGLKNQIYYPNLHKYIHRYIIYVMKIKWIGNP
ncbi:unnamed protein product [Hermetia illucens]|uniref:Uncharacterized protein n=1 Tax=Hermetia illucens TaxID=343691 RepID=A0A7R8UWT5_HERIL|nr:unnamed protein product [Hermetia illucens]